MLRRRRVRAVDRDDIRHDVALAALSALRDGQIRSSLDGWCVAVAVNAANRLWRERERHIDSEIPDDEAAGDDTESAVEGRLELEALVRAWAFLPERDRTLLTWPSPDGLDDADRNRHYVALHRARARLRTMLSAGALAAVSWQDRWLRRSRLARWLHHPAGIAAAIATPVVVASVIVAGSAVLDGPRTAATADRSKVEMTGVPPFHAGASLADVTSGPVGDRRAPESAPTSTSPRVEHNMVDVPAPLIGRAYAGKYDTPERKPAVCIWHAGLLDRTCIDYPIRP